MAKIGVMKVRAPEKHDELFRVRDAARPLGIEEKTLRVWMASGKIGFVRLGRSVRVPLSEINRVISSGFQPAKGDAA
jgi:excisionase family DNA binding protein